MIQQNKNRQKSKRSSQHAPPTPSQTSSRITRAQERQESSEIMPENSNKNKHPMEDSSGHEDGDQVLLMTHKRARQYTSGKEEHQVYAMVGSEESEGEHQ